MVWVSTFSNPESLKTCTAFSWIPSMLKSADVQKPAKGGDNQGAIYLWARLVEDSASEPRAYRLPYSEKLHEKVISALNSSRRGTRQQGTVMRRSGSGPRGAAERQHTIQCIPRAGSAAEAAALAGSSVAFALRSGYAPSVTRVSKSSTESLLRLYP